MMNFVEFCALDFANGGEKMTIKDRLMPYIKQSNLSFEEISLMLGMSPDRLDDKLKSNCLNVKEAYELSKMLEIERPSDVFFP